MLENFKQKTKIIDRCWQTDRISKTAHNITYPKDGVSCSKDSFVVNQTSVFQIKFCGKSPALRIAAKAFIYFTTTPSLISTSVRKPLQKPFTTIF